MIVNDFKNETTNKEEIKRFLEILGTDPREIRLPKNNRMGFYTDPDKFVEAISAWSDREDCSACYLTINPVKQMLFSTCQNDLRTSFSGGGASDKQIEKRSAIVIDIDRTKKGGNASDEELAAGEKFADTVSEYLASKGWGSPVKVMSGNGWHLWFKLDLPCNDETDRVINSVLKSLATRFKNPDYDIDTSVGNRSRIIKIPGTCVRKYPETDERPWRVSRLVAVPSESQVVSLESLQSVVDVIPEKPAQKPKQTESEAFEDDYEMPELKKLKNTHVEEALKWKGWGFKKPVDWNGGSKWILDKCPNCKNHTGEGETDGPKDTAVFLNDGVLGFECFHSHCKEINIYEMLKEHLPKKEEAAVVVAEKVVTKFLESIKSKHPISVDEDSIYYWDGKKYVKQDLICTELRQFCKRKKWGRSSSMIGNVKKNIIADVCRPYKEMPFWDGPEAPFEKESDIIAFSNGIMNINNSEILPHSPKWVSTFCLPFGYDALASCPTWIKFLGEIFPEGTDRSDLLQEYFGYCLTQDTSLQKALILIGKPRSGKGTIQRILTELVGKANSTGFSIDSLAKEFGLACLVDKTLATIGEVELTNNPNRAKITEVLKGIIGRDDQDINVKHVANNKSVQLPTRFLIATNTIPQLTDSSGALAMRFLFIPFFESFFGREDIDLEEKLIAELPGIANWALEGLARLRANKGKFTIGEHHRTIHKGYSTTTSPVLTWITQCCVIEKRASSGDLPESCLTTEQQKTMKSAVYACYVDWCRDNDTFELKENTFFKSLHTAIPKLGTSQERIEEKVTGTVKRVYFLSGIGLKKED